MAGSPFSARRSPALRFPVLLLGLLVAAGCAEPEFVPGFDHLTPEEEVVDSAKLRVPELPAGSAAVAGEPDPDPGDSALVPPGPGSARPSQGPVGPGDQAPPSRPDSLAGRVDAPDPDPGEPSAGRFRRPEQIRGIYLNAWAAGSSRRRAALIDLARRTEINTFVIDIKDATGFVSHRSRVPLVDSIGADEELRIGDLPGLLDQLEAEGIYPIARIVIVKDPLLTAARPDLAVQDTAGGVWVDSKGLVWLNAFNPGVWEYHVALAREVAEMGFPEIQWDYVRFPDAPKSDLDRALFPGQAGRRKDEAVREGLGYAREALSDLGVRMTADVFGVTTSTTRDVGIGQVWTSFIDQVDAALPMVYPSHYWTGSFGFEKPNAHPYEIVRRALEDALEQSAGVEGAGETIPWLQDFSLGDPAYGAPEVRAQIQATYDAGIRDWILWNPGSRYTEEGLEPAGGWPAGEEPLMRVAGRIVPVSRRMEVLEGDRWTTGTPGEASPRTMTTGDSLILVEPVTPDSLLGDTVPGLPDTVPGAASPGFRLRR